VPAAENSQKTRSREKFSTLVAARCDGAAFRRKEGANVHDFRYPATLFV
jgi:hypothetical protein